MAIYHLRRINPQHRPAQAAKWSLTSLFGLLVQWRGYRPDICCIKRRLPSPRKSGREELVCGGLGKEETLHLMGFPSIALSINDSSGLKRQLLINLKSFESNTQQALDENSLIRSYAFGQGELLVENGLEPAGEYKKSSAVPVSKPGVPAAVAAALPGTVILMLLGQKM